MRSLGLLIPVLALLIPIVAIVMRHWRAVKLRELDLLARQAADAGGDATTRLARLEERVRVLETIVTDPARRLAHEIDRLKDPQDGGA
ncbi:MAG: hypothetical protein NZM40_00440 [Sphingomonadaceae bacterium]|uniref:hypothetical protein n=1 Tax=Thermaurantiacus sp. TaxID=2820283 RepID=UPI00298EF7F7|nr:hypothetical protein [Thermaurantiacus sp.]MCS6985909.1 hypothetical protein [Sphingomonadaceae bacterium]MDW8414875.1 hypothetical protein [Thermaurantiacus sp.]